METKDLIFLIALAIGTIAYFITHYYLNRDRIQFKARYGSKGIIYHKLHLLIVNENKDAESYDPSFKIKKYLNETLEPRNTDPAEWKTAIDYWKNLLEQFPIKLISRLENKISLSDIEYFDRLAYSDETTSFFKKEVSVFLKELGVEWANKKRKFEQANRLGYFAIKGNIILEDHKAYYGNWLDLWNDFLGLQGEKRLKKGILVLNPLDESERRTLENNRKKVEEIRAVFKKYPWQTGVRLAEKLLEE